MYTIFMMIVLNCLKRVSVSREIDPGSAKEAANAAPSKRMAFVTGLPWRVNWKSGGELIMPAVGRDWCEIDCTISAKLLSRLWDCSPNYKAPVTAPSARYLFLSPVWDQNAEM